MRALDKFQTKLEGLTTQLDRLNRRERIMVIFCIIFVLVAAIGTALWYTHKAAQDQQQRADHLKDLLVWMQSNAVSMKSGAEMQMSVIDKVKRVAQQQSLTLNVAEVSNQVQIQTQHSQYNVLANFLTQMTQMGVSIEKMQLISENGQIKLTATVQ